MPNAPAMPGYGQAFRDISHRHRSRRSTLIGCAPILMASAAERRSHRRLSSDRPLPGGSALELRLARWHVLGASPRRSCPKGVRDAASARRKPDGMPVALVDPSRQTYFRSMPDSGPSRSTDENSGLCQRLHRRFPRVLAELDDDSVNLVVTSPPFALQRKKEYGNEEQNQYVDWLAEFARPSA